MTEHLLDHADVYALLDRPTVPRGEHQVMILPAIPGPERLGRLPIMA